MYSYKSSLIAVIVIIGLAISVGFFVYLSACNRDKLTLASYSIRLSQAEIESLDHLRRSLDALILESNKLQNEPIKSDLIKVVTEIDLRLVLLKSRIPSRGSLSNRPNLDDYLDFIKQGIVETEPFDRNSEP